jgi:hypothetical protein
MVLAHSTTWLFSSEKKFIPIVATVNASVLIRMLEKTVY